MKLDVSRGRKDLGGDEGAETMLEIHCMKNYFQLKVLGYKKRTKCFSFDLYFFQMTLEMQQELLH